MEDKRGYRRCVRIVIIKGNYILLGQKIIDGKFVGYEFPGGGVEDGDSFDETVVKEAKEEVGIRVKNPESLDISFRYEIDYPNPERAKLYRGGEDNWFMAEFDRSDKINHGIEGDALPHTWETIDNAIRKIKGGPKSEYNPARLEALEKVKRLKSSRSKVSLESW